MSATPTAAERATSAAAADLATVIYTSGTTGRPKGCELTHENLLSVIRNTFMGPLAAIHSVSGASTLLFLPLAHVFARVIEIGCLESGIVLGHCDDMANLLPELASFQPSFVLAVPRVFEKVYNGAEAKAVADGRGKIFARAAATAVAYSESLGSPPAPGCGCGPSTPSSTGWSTTSSGPPSAAGPPWRSPAARRSPHGSGTSSAASASPSSRGTGSPRRARRCR